MNGILDEIRSRVGESNLSDSCGRDGCKADMTGLPSCRIIVDIDRAFPEHGMEGQRCDFVLFLPCTGGNLLAVPIELKSGRVDVSQAAKQLQGGAAFIERFAPKTSTCRPILFHGKGIHSKELEDLNRAKIKFRGLSLTIKKVRCNRPQNLARTLKP